MTSTGDDAVDHRRPSNGDIYARLDRIEDLLSKRLDKQDVKLDSTISRLDKLEGGLSMLKWLGPTGIAALLWAMLQSAGIV